MQRRTRTTVWASVLIFLTIVPAAHAASACLGKDVTISGTGRDERLRGTPGDDVIDAGAGDDLVLGRGGDDLICGGAGDDVLEGGRGADRLGGGPGTDLASFARSFGRDAAAARRDFRGVRASLATGTATGDGRDRIEGLEGLVGSRLSDLLVGDGRANLVAGLGGHDRLRGGGGRDVVTYQLAPDPVKVDLGAGFAESDADNDVLRDFESAIGTVFDGDELRGDDGPNVLTGLDGHDVIDGRGGNDVLHTEGGLPVTGGPGDDIIDAYAVSYAGATAGVTVDLPRQLATGEGRDRLRGVAEVYGSPFDDAIIGTEDENVFEGGDGADALDGGGNGDELTGQAGDDSLLGGSGVDRLFGGPGNDALDGGDDGDALHGDAGDDRLSGGLGEDFLFGDTGVDPFGNPTPSGNDDIDGGEGRDVVSYMNSATGVDVDLAAGRSTGEGDDALRGIENVVGTAHDDRVAGDDGPNEIYSGAGADKFYGRGGDDILQAIGQGSELDGGDGQDACRGAATETNCELD